MLVDDASNDGGATRAAIERIAEQWPGELPLVVPVFLPQNLGAAAARNAGWAMSRQPYVAFLDADDAWHSRKLEIQLNWMHVHPEAAMTATIRTHDGGTSDLSAPVGPVTVREVLLREALLHNCIPTSSVVVRADVACRFAAGKRYGEDYLLWLDVLASGHRVFLFEAPLTYAFKHSYGEAGLSAHLWRMQRGEIDCYRRLATRGAIGPVARRGAELLSWTKFARRPLLALPLKLRRPGAKAAAVPAGGAQDHRTEPAGGPRLAPQARERSMNA